MALDIGTTEPTEIKVTGTNISTSLNVLKCGIMGAGLSEATRSSVSSYSKSNLDGYVGLISDTWSGITNASSLVAGEYYYIRVLVTDTNKYGKFCVRFKSYSGQTITVDNIGWGYDGEVIATIPVWGKPFSLITNGSDATISVTRVSSQNQHAATDTLYSGSKIYYGDVIRIVVMPITPQYALDNVKINGVEQTLSDGAFDTTITVTSSISITAVAGKYTKSWKTTFSGAKSTTLSCELFNDPFTQERPTSEYERKNIALSEYNISNSATTNPIRITCTLKVTIESSGTSNNATTTLTSHELTTSWTRKTNNVSITVGASKYTASAYASLRAETNNLGLQINVQKSRNLTNATGTVDMTVTKVEQYY